MEEGEGTGCHVIRYEMPARKEGLESPSSSCMEFNRHHVEPLESAGTPSLLESVEIHMRNYMKLK